MFGMMAAMASDTRNRLRWRLADDDRGQAGLLDGAERVPGVRELAGLEFLHVQAQRVVNRVPDASRMPFRYTINAYRGCSHACVYCFARPTHEYLDLDAGRDFETRIVVKINAVERVRAELSSPRWGGDLIAMGTNTDPYQPCEGRYRLTRGIVEALVEAGNPFSILTKSTLVLRDLDVLAEGARRGLARVDLSIGCLDRGVWRLTEPSTPDPTRRMEAVAQLNEAGVPCGVMVAPVIPGISDGDDQLDAVVAAAVEAGAQSVAAIPLHLRPGVREHYLGWLSGARPDLVAEYRRRYTGAYLPSPDRRDLAARVHALVVGHRGRVGPPRGIARPQLSSARRQGEAPAEIRDDPRQLRLAV
jgi:DNA repair photolyase